MDSSLFIKAYRKSSDTEVFSIDLESLVAIFVYQVSAPEKISLRIKIVTSEPSTGWLPVDLSGFFYKIIESESEKATYCVWPIILLDENIVAGLCSVARQLIKCSQNENIRQLLGFREACLMACTESSIWTRFCEIDITNSVRMLLTSPETFLKENGFELPQDVSRFEYHMQQPVRIHNVYKVAREKSNNKDLKSSVPLADLNLHHTFGEGPFMTLADIILYPCFQIFFSLLTHVELKLKLPLVSAWYATMQSSGLPELKLGLLEQKIMSSVVIEPEFVKQSLYTADPARYRPEKRIFTKQSDVERSINGIGDLTEEIINGFLPYGYEINFDWADVPLDANPNGGALPAKRADRKCEQLENLARAVVKLSKDKAYKIVDFCSGSGHLGILLACLLPDCEIILVENKERSLARARERIDRLGLNNVTVVQSNLDYFVGNFDVGVSLHACGVATDLVMENCIKQRAHFVSCPCCYGGIRECYHLKYPRSEQFKSLNLGCNYWNLAHAADQTHDPDNGKTEQGYLCMNIIDTDRRFYAQSCGYEVFLAKLQPATCTNKNNLLVGVYKNK